MANDYYINDSVNDNAEDDKLDLEYAQWQEEFQLWSTCNDVAELMVTKGYKSIMSIIDEMVTSKYKDINIELKL